MGGTDSRSVALTRNGRLRIRYADFRDGNVRLVLQLVEAAVRHHYAGLNSGHRGPSVIRSPGLHDLHHDVVFRTALLAFSSLAGCPALTRSPLARAAALPAAALLRAATRTRTRLTRTTVALCGIRISRPRLDQINERRIAVMLDRRRRHQDLVLQRIHQQL